MESFLQQMAFSDGSKSTSPTGANKESSGNSTIDYIMSSNQRPDDFINSLSESEIGALNACYITTTTNAYASSTNKPAITKSQQDLYSQLFLPIPDRKAPSNETSSMMMNLLPTPIGGSCHIVQTTDQVPLNQSLILQSKSLAAMFQPLPGISKLPNTADDKGLKSPPSSPLMESFFANIGTSPIIGGSKTNLMVEADFGSSSSPLIAAAAAVASPLLSNLALPMTLQSASLSLTDNNTTSASSFESRDQHHRSQQSTRWNERYQELIQYQYEHGDCNVPYLWSKNRPLSEWVKRQRHQYKIKQEGKNSALTDNREALLTQLGFVWNSRDSLWDGRFQELVKYFHHYGNLKVSKHHTAQHRALSVWLKRQRHACRLHVSGDRSTCMTEERMQKLLHLGIKIVKKP